MNIEDFKQKYAKKEPSFAEIAEIISEESFNEAGRLGFEYAKQNNMHNEETFPFAIDRVRRAQIRVIFNDNLKPLINKMESLAKQESDDGSFKLNHYEAAFCLVGEKTKDKIINNNAFWDERGFKPNKTKFYDPDDYGGFGYDSFYDHSSNVVAVSSDFIDKMEEICQNATGDNLVVIYGHTHPQLDSLGKLNNYPSVSDITSSVSEAVEHYQQKNGYCTFLNAIVNADGDLNIFGYDMSSKRFIVFDKLVYQSGAKINALTDENYPLSSYKGSMGE